jgi:hypothetical protein
LSIREEENWGHSIDDFSIVNGFEGEFHSTHNRCSSSWLQVIDVIC